MSLLVEVKKGGKKDRYNKSDHINNPHPELVKRMGADQSVHRLAVFTL
jgi:hypothetical protein